jgi:hypothetical protein
MANVLYLKTFTHGYIRAVNGERAEIDDHEAKRLEKAGLLRIITETAPVKKTTAAGQEEPQSSLPAAPPSVLTTSSVSEPGVKRRRGRPRRNVESS